MSSHHSQQFFNLHHNQVNAGKARREQNQAAKLKSFLEGRQQALAEGWCIRGFSVLCFAFTILATAVYMRSLVGI